MAYSGVQYTNRVDNFTERKLYAKVVDNILTGNTYAARVMGMAKEMTGKTYDYTVKITSAGGGEWFTGLETLSSAAADTTVTLSYAHNAFTQPVVSVMLESFANAGPQGTIDIDTFKFEEAIAEAGQKIGDAAYSTGSASQMLGLGALNDDATDVATIGGQSRNTYTVLKSTRTSWSTALTLAKMATLEDTISAVGLGTEEPNLNLTTKTVWSLYEQLLSPQVRADYSSVGYNKIALRGNDIVKPVELAGALGFTALSYRGKPVLKDDRCTSGNWFMLNERYQEVRGRTVVPLKYRGKIEKVDMGEFSTYEGVGKAEMPSAKGWFFMPNMMLPNQAGQIGRIFYIGQFCGSQFRRQGRGTTISTV
jgi:hypothetical protein